MKKLLIIVTLFLAMNIANANTSALFDFWKLDSVEYQGKTTTPQQRADVQVYIDVTKKIARAGGYVLHFYGAAQTSSRGIERFYIKDYMVSRFVKAKDKDEEDKMILFGYDRHVCSLKNNGESMQCTLDRRKGRKTSNFSKANKAKTLKYINSRTYKLEQWRRLELK